MGKAGCRLAPTVRCARVAQKELHSGIQVKPYTRPSLRSGRTAYAAVSREPSSFWPPSPRELTMPSARSGSRASSKGLTVATTARTTRFCRTRGSHVRAGFSRAVDVTGKMLARRTFQRRSSARGCELTGTTRPARTLRADAAASTATRLATRDDTRSPLKTEPGWATHTTNPNFCKVEYFGGDGLTTPPVETSRCFARRAP